MTRRTAAATVWCLVLLAAATASAKVIEAVQVPGTWFDQEKHWTIEGRERFGNYYQDLDANGEFTPGEPWSENLPAGGTGDVDADWNKDVAENWGSWLWHRSGDDKWYYDDQNTNGSYDIGEPTADSLAADIDEDHREDAAETWPAPWDGGDDLSCWAATASNLVRYVSGYDRYHAWMYIEGCDGKTWVNGGFVDRGLENDGYAARFIVEDANKKYLTVNPVQWCVDRLSEGLPIGLSMYSPSAGTHAVGGHAVTLWGIDTNTNTLYTSNSDGDPHFSTGNYTWQDNEWHIVWPSGGWNYLSAATFDTYDWQGSGTGGDTSMSGPTTLWSNPANWPTTVPNAQHLPKLEFANVGVVNVDAFAQGLKCIVKGAATKLAINGSGHLSVRSIHTMDNGEIEVNNGLLNADYEIINESLMDINGGVVSCGNRMYVGADATATVHHTGGSVGTNALYLGHSTTGHGTYNLGVGAVLTATTEYIGHEGSGYVVQTGGLNTTTVDLFVGYRDGSYGQYDLNGFTAELASKDAWVGAFGRGCFYHTYGDHTLTGELDVGRAATADGLYQLDDGILIAPCETIGRFGKGEFIHTGGINRISDTLQIGKYAGSQGFYRLSGGRLELLDDGQIIIGHQGTNAGLEVTNGTVDAQDMTVGGKGAAEVDQTGGTVTIAGTLGLAEQIGSTGTYRLNGAAARLEPATMEVGQAGTGTVYHTLGTNAVAGTLSLGSTADGTGWYYLEPGATLTAADVDIGTVGTGTFVQNGGFLDVRHGTLRIGGDTGTGTLAMTDGVVIAEEIALVPSSGTFEDLSTDWILRVNTLTGFGTNPSFQGTLQLGHTAPDGIADYSLAASDSLAVGKSLAVAYDSRGKLTQEASSTVTVGHTLTVGHQDGCLGTYTLRGSLTVSGDAHIGHAGKGTMDQLGGTSTVNGTLCLGFAASGEGTYQMQPGNLSQPTLSANQELIGGLGTGTFWQWNGTHTVTTDMWLGAVGGSHGTYHLRNGELHVPTLNIGSAGGGIGEFNWDDGTLHADTVTVHPGSTMNVNTSSVWAIDVALNIHGGAVEMESTPLYVSHPDGALLHITDGSLKPAEFRVGSADKGTVTQTGGAITAFGDLRMAYYTSGSGTYTMDGGSLTVNGEGYVGDRANATFTQNNGTVEFTENLYLGCASGAVGRYELFGGSLTCDKLYVGYGGTGIFKQLTGTTLNANEIHVADGSSMVLADHFLVSGHFGLLGSSLDLGTNHFIVDGLDAESEMGGAASLQSGDQCYGDARKGAMKQLGGHNRAHGTLTIGHHPGATGSYSMTGSSVLEAFDEMIGDGGEGDFDQHGGTHTCTGTLTLGCQTGGRGSYTIGGGTLDTDGLAIGGQGAGRFDFADPDAHVYVRSHMSIGPLGALQAVAGARIHMTGSHFDNESTDPTAMAGLANLELIFEGGTDDIDLFEVAGRDIGYAIGAFDLNFDLGRLILGSGEGIGQLRLVNQHDNWPAWDGPEAAYVHDLVIGSGSYLDLNGLNLYYLHGSIHPDATIVGGTLSVVPEPTTVGLLAIGSLLAALRRRRPPAA